MQYQIQVPSHLFGGRGSIEKLADILKRYQAKKVLLFTDKGVRSAGLCECAQKLMAKEDVCCTILDGVTAEPSVYDVDHVIRQAEEIQADLVIAVGGGSVMDTAKLASVLIGADYTIFDLIKNPSLAQKKIPSVMIPTTCGTGSEATCNAIVAIPEESSKKGIVNAHMIPDDVILDVDMIAKLPQSIVAATGVDALAHAVECYTSKKATPMSDTYAIAAAKLIFTSLEDAYQEEGNLKAKERLLLGAFYGGVAITGSGTTAVHALSYPLGGKYHIAHGVSNAILFAPVMTHNQPACADRLAALCDAVYPLRAQDSTYAKAAYIVQRIAGIVKHTEIPTSLQKFGIGESDLDFLVHAGSQQQRLLVNNQREFSLDDIRSIYRQVI